MAIFVLTGTAMWIHFGRSTVRVEAPTRDGEARHQGPIVQRGEFGPTSDNSSALEPSATLHLDGRVLEHGRPVPRARLTVRVGSDVRSTMTGEDGTFSTRFAGGGVVTVEVPGLDVTSQSASAVSEDVRDFVIEVTGAASVSGRVLYRGSPVGGASVTDLATGRSTVTDTSGTYQFTDVVPGRHILRSVADDLDAENRPFAITLKPAENSQLVDLVLDRGGRMSGIVVDESNMPVADVTVWFSCRPCESFGFASTGADGRFIIRRLAGGGPYEASVVTANGTHYPPARGTVHPVVHLEDGTSALDDVRLRIASTELAITGRVLDASGRPVSAVRVIVPPSPDPIVLRPREVPAASTWTDTKGAFILDGLPAGKYTVAVGEQGELGSISDIEAGQRGVTVVIPELVTVHGSIEGISGFRDVGYIAAAGNPGSSRHMRIESNSFTFEKVPTGNAWFYATDGTLTAVQQVHVQPESPSPLVLRARRGRDVSIRVVGDLTSDVACRKVLLLPRMPDVAVGIGVPGSDGTLMITAPDEVSVRVDCRSSVNQPIVQGSATIGPQASSAEVVLESKPAPALR